MSEYNIEVEGGKSVRLKTAGKYCDRNIVVTATGGGGDTDAAYQEGLTAGIEQGKQAEENRFWSAYQDNGNRKDYSFAFAGSGWTNETINPVYPITPTNGFEMFRASGEIDLTSIGVAVDFSQNTSFSNFAYQSRITHIGVVDTTSAKALSYTFYKCNQLVTIDKLVLKSDGSQTLGNTTFSDCDALQNIVIEGVIGYSINFQWSPFKKSSIESVIAALSDSTTGLAATFKGTAVNKAFETSSGAADGSTSAEWLALKATKGNWNISLV